MAIVVSQEGDKAVIRPSTMEIAAGSLPALRTQMREIVGNGARELVVDLANVQAVDASGIGLLVSAHNLLHRLGGRLVVVHASQDILDLLHAMRLHKHFNVNRNDPAD
ncbi:MAG TPA: STAS domain-containing protein [Bryobacteraceae bacterium]|jgi:anti-anti-sigma factor|nr:STAS domain-containing protein [Bryobacteraceae bacterium]